MGRLLDFLKGVKPQAAADGLQIGNLQQIVGYLQAQQQLQNMQADMQNEMGIGNLYGSIPGSMVGVGGGGRVPTLAARELEANMMANPRDFIKLAFMRAGEATPGGLRPLQNDYLTGKLYRAEGEREVYYVDPSTGLAHWIQDPDTFISGWGGGEAGNPWAQEQVVDPNWIGQNFKYGDVISGQFQGFGDTPQTPRTVAPSRSVTGDPSAWFSKPGMYQYDPNKYNAPVPMAEGGAVEGPVISTVGEKGPEFALLAPGSVIAPNEGGGEMDMAAAIQAIIMQLMKTNPEAAQQLLAMLQGGGMEGGQPQGQMPMQGQPQGRQAMAPMMGQPMQAADGITTFHPNQGAGANLNDIPKIPFINQLLEMQGGQTSTPWVGTQTPFGSAKAINPYNANTAFALNNALPTDYSMGLAYNSAFGIPDEDTQSAARSTIEGYGLVNKGTRGLISNLLR